MNNVATAGGGQQPLPVYIVYVFIIMVLREVTFYASRKVAADAENELQIEKEQYAKCLNQMLRTCNPPVMRYISIKLWLIVLMWTVLCAMSTPRILLACLNLLGYSSTGGLSRVARFLRNWATRHQHRKCLFVFGKLENYAILGWTVRVGILLMAVGGVAGFCVGLRITGIV